MACMLFSFAAPAKNTKTQKHKTHAVAILQKGENNNILRTPHINTNSLHNYAMNIGHVFK